MTSLVPFSVQRIEPIGYDAKTNAYWLIGRMCFPSRVPLGNLTYAPQPTDSGYNASHPDPPRASSANVYLRENPLHMHPQAGLMTMSTTPKLKRPRQSVSAPNAHQPSQLYPRRPVPQQLALPAPAASRRQSLNLISRAVAAAHALRRCRRTRNSTCKRKNLPSSSARQRPMLPRTGRRDPQDSAYEDMPTSKARAPPGQRVRLGRRPPWAQERARGYAVRGKKTRARNGSRYPMIGCTRPPSLHFRGLHAVAHEKAKPRRRPDRGRGGYSRRAR